MSSDLVLALDLGTTNVRALLVAADGSVLARATRPLAASFPRPGELEQDPIEMWDRSLEVLRETIAAADVEPAAIAGIGIVTQRASCLAWDSATGVPLAPAIGWQDQRTHQRVAELRDLGIPINTLASATKFEWWMRNDAAVQKAASAGTLRLGTPDAWLGFKLTGGAAHVTDPGNASCTALFDPSAGQFAEPLCALFGVPFEALPEVVSTNAIVGETSAALLGAPLAVAARAGDQQASAFAQGIFTPGEMKLTLGTSAMLDVHAGSEPAEIRDGAFPLALWTLESGESAFCLEGTVITAGSCVEWLVQLGLFASAAEVDREARSVGSDHGVIVVPSLQGLGTPTLDDAARGFMMGLTRGSGRGEIARATLEGVAHRCVDVIETIAPAGGTLRVDGGLGQSEVLLQALADYSGRDVLRAREIETTALGAAFLAGLTLGVWASPSECVAVLPEPDRRSGQTSSAEVSRARERWSDAIARARSEPLLA